MSDTDISKMKVADLKRELKLRGLTTTGNKTELQDRLHTALLDGDLSLDTAIPGEDLLDEDPVLTDEEEKILGGDENELLKSPTPTSAAAADLSIAEKANATTISTKKVVLKRKNSFTLNNITSPKEAAEEEAVRNTKENTEPSPAKTMKMSERNPITIENNSNGAGTDGNSENKDKTSAGSATAKVSQLSLQERLELRAKKFGLNTNKTSPSTTDNVKDNANGNAGNISVANSDKQIEMLKKRAERFGCVVSSKIAKLEAAEKLQKRKERFGIASSNSTSNTVTTAESSVWAEKARQRLERFKTASTPAVTVKSTTAPAVGN